MDNFIVIPFTSGPLSMCGLIQCIKQGWSPFFVYIPHLFEKNTRTEFLCVKSLTENLQDKWGNHFWNSSYKWNRILSISGKELASANNAERLSFVFHQCVKIAEEKKSHEFFGTLIY